MMLKINSPVIYAMNSYTLKEDWCDRRTRILQNENIDYKIEANRLKSYTGHWLSSSPLTPAELSAAGFYYTGPVDRVQCAWCKGGLYSWKAGDIAVSEHKKHFPKCPFIENKICGMVGVVKRNSHDDSSRDDVKLSRDDAKLTSVVKIVGDMGYSTKIIDEAASKIKEKNGLFTTSELLDAIYEIEEEQQRKPQETPAACLFKHSACNIVDDESRMREIPEEARIQTYDRQSVVINNSIIKLPHTVNHKIAETSSLVQNKEEIDTLKEENKRLKDSKTCKICLDKEVNMLFLPCRHLVCCEQCVDSVRYCPLCRSEIVATVKTFLS